MKYCVTVSRVGWLYVEVDSEGEAMDIANHQTTDTVNWSEDWEPTDAEIDESQLDGEYIREKEFE